MGALTDGPDYHTQKTLASVVTREAFLVPEPRAVRKNPSPLAVYRAPVVTPTASFLPEQAGQYQPGAG